MAKKEMKAKIMLLMDEEGKIAIQLKLDSSLTQGEKSLIACHLQFLKEKIESEIKKNIKIITEESFK